jgi:hypothetical protein
MLEPTVRKETSNDLLVRFIDLGKLIHQAHHARIQLLEYTRSEQPYVVAGCNQRDEEHGEGNNGHGASKR